MFVVIYSKVLHNLKKKFKIIKIYSKCLILLTNFKNVLEILRFLCSFYNLASKYLKYVVNKVKNGEKMVRFYIFSKMVKW